MNYISKLMSGKLKLNCFIAFVLGICLPCIANGNINNNVLEIEQWKEVELVFFAEKIYPNPYTDIDFWVEFTGPSDEKIVRPGFWDGKNIFKVRFASPTDSGKWIWNSHSSDLTDKGLDGKQGYFLSKPYKGNNGLIKNGLLKMSPGKRNVVHANGNSFLMIGDTPWAIPFRGTVETVTEYARNRQEIGFNAALLLSLQPDQNATGPRNRIEPGGFDIAFEDLKNGHINLLNPSYFQYFDTLRNILIEHGIVPVYQPVFQGYGWKGKNTLGYSVKPNEYVRYCRYLVARFGAMPAMWLVSADSDGRADCVSAGGEEIEKWDAYKQPTGIHYSIWDDYKPEWWNNPEEYKFHFNRINQDQVWLDFQWCQTGHAGKHIFHKVSRMYGNLPVKAVANGEPTYEGVGNPSNASGWWQGHEAWSQFLSGGTMGVVYGAGGLYQWKFTADESGWEAWANSNISWRDAIKLPGATYVGYLGKALKGIDITDIERYPLPSCEQLCLAKPGALYIAYLPEGGNIIISALPENGIYKWFNPVTGKILFEGKLEHNVSEFKSPLKGPCVLIIKKT